MPTLEANRVESAPDVERLCKACGEVRKRPAPVIDSPESDLCKKCEDAVCKEYDGRVNRETVDDFVCKNRKSQPTNGHSTGHSGEGTSSEH